MSGYYDYRVQENPPREAQVPPMRMSSLGSGRVLSGRPRLGQFEGMATEIANKIVVAFTPQLQELTAKAAEAAQPVISRVVREDVIPGVGPYIIVGMIGLGAIAAVIGAAMARKVRTA